MKRISKILLGLDYSNLFLGVTLLCGGGYILNGALENYDVLELLVGFVMVLSGIWLLVKKSYTRKG